MTARGTRARLLPGRCSPGDRRGGPGRRRPARRATTDRQTIRGPPPRAGRHPGPGRPPMPSAVPCRCRLRRAASCASRLKRRSIRSIPSPQPRNGAWYRRGLFRRSPWTDRTPGDGTSGRTAGPVVDHLDEAAPPAGRVARLTGSRSGGGLACRPPLSGELVDVVTALQAEMPHQIEVALAHEVEAERAALPHQRRGVVVLPEADGHPRQRRKQRRARDEGRDESAERPSMSGGNQPPFGRTTRVCLVTEERERRNSGDVNTK
jgi:hypothetical protein